MLNVELMGELIKKMIKGDLTAVVFLPPQVFQKPPRFLITSLKRAAQ